MSLTPDALIREWFDQVWNRLDASAIERLMAPDGVVHGLAPQPLRGPAQFKPFYEAMRQVLTDIRVDVERAVVQGDTCAVWCHVTARYLGDPAANRRVDFHGMTMARVRDGKIVEGWNSFDFLRMYQQLGWVPDPVQPTSV